MDGYEFLTETFEEQVAAAAASDGHCEDLSATEVTALLEAKRAASDALQIRMDERLRPRASADAETETPTGTIVRYEPWALPRGNVVIEMPSKRIEAAFSTIEECQTHADQLNKWLAARPASDRRYRMFVVPAEPTEAQLVALIDRIYEPEEQLHALAVERIHEQVEADAAEA